jgi:hypothetical protein
VPSLALGQSISHASEPSPRAARMVALASHARWREEALADSSFADGTWIDALAGP